jgi:predicted NAD/FAD-binding protein
MQLKEILFGRYSVWAAVCALTALSALGLLFAAEFIWPTVVFGTFAILGFRDYFKSTHPVRANYPLMGRLRYLLESIRPELRQYFWSSDLNDVNQMPALFFIRFFKNHGLLSVTDRPQWYTLPGGSRSYIAPLTEGFRERIRLNTPVVSVRNTSQGVEVVANKRKELFDVVVLASHSDQSLALLDDTEASLKSILQGIPYADNEVVLHTDRSQMPKSLRAWASWNYQIQATPEGVGAVVTYDMNRLQNLNGPHQFFVTLNNTKHINPEKILGRWTYAHPQFGPESLAIQAQIDSINSDSKILVAGAWCRNGFHEDGVVSGEKAAEAVKKTLGIYA